MIFSGVERNKQGNIIKKVWSTQRVESLRREEIKQPSALRQRPERVGILRTLWINV